MDRRDVLKGAALTAGVVATVGAAQGVSATEAAAQTAGVGIKDIPPVNPEILCSGTPRRAHADRHWLCARHGGSGGYPRRPRRGEYRRS